MKSNDILKALFNRELTVDNLQNVINTYNEFQDNIEKMKSIGINVTVSADSTPRWSLIFYSLLNPHKKIATIKLIRELGGFGLADAKLISEKNYSAAGQFTVLNKYPMNDIEATKWIRAFEEAGSEVRMIPA